MTSHVFTRLSRRVLVAMCLLALALPLSAQDKGFESKQYDIGIEGGMWLSGEINFDSDLGSIDVDKNTSLLLRAFADMYVAPKFAVGGYLNYATGELEYAGNSADASFYEFGIALKPRLLLSPTVALKPGLNIGYRHLERDRVDAIDPADADLSADGLGVNLSVELQFLLSGGYIFFVDGGFLSQPAGGNDDADVTWSPIIYLAAGICF